MKNEASVLKKGGGIRVLSVWFEKFKSIASKYSYWNVESKF